MFAELRTKIGFQIFALFGVISILIFAPTAYFIWLSVDEFGTFASTVNEKQIRNQTHSYLVNTAHEQSQRYDNYLEKVRVTAALLASEASHIYTSRKHVETNHSQTAHLFFQDKNQMFITPPEEEITTIYWGGDTLHNDITSEIKGLSRMDPLFLTANSEIPESIAIHTITTSGIGRYYTRHKDAKKILYNLPNPSQFDLRDGAPITIFTKDELDNSTAQWTPVYKDDIINGLMVTASGPIIDGQQNFRGIVGIDLPLSTITDELQHIKDASIKKGQRILLGFIIDKSGRLISFPIEYQDRFGLTFSTNEFNDSSDIVEQSLSQSTLPQIQKLQKTIINNTQETSTISINDETYIVASHKMEKIGWYLTLVLSEEDMLSSIYETETAFQHTLSKLQNKFLSLLFNGTIFLLLLILFLVKRYINPLKQVTDTALKIGKGDLTARCSLQQSDELGVLASSINKMVTQLSSADQEKQIYAMSLEEEIGKRTLALERTNNELTELVTRLNLENKKRQKITSALIESEQQLRSVMEFSCVGLSVIQRRKFKYVNAGLARILGYSQEELFSFNDFTDILQPDYRALINDQLTERLSGTVGTPYPIQAIKSDRSIVDLQVEGAPISWKGKVAVLVTIVDISHSKAIENKLITNETILQRSLEEKEILLKEVYHRTKNNMLVIISLLNLQMDEIEDKKALSLFKETENRIRTMSLMHESLYQTTSLTNIDLAQYISKIAANLIESMTTGDHITLELDCEKVSISIDKAMPLGLAVNEIITNAIQHAFPNNIRGVVQIKLSQDDKGNTQLNIGDSGIGINENIDPQKSESLGLQIIGSLIDKQVKGTYSVIIGVGTTYLITFKNNS